MSEQPLQLDDRLGLSVKEAAACIGVSERHLRTVLSEIPHTYLGNRVVIPVEPFKEWLRERARSEEQSSDEVANDIMKELHSPTTRGNE